MTLLEREAVLYECIEIDLSKNQQKTDEELGRVCPVRQVPAIDDKGFPLFERLVSSSRSGFSGKICSMCKPKTTFCLSAGLCCRTDDRMDLGMDSHRKIALWNLIL